MNKENKFHQKLDKHERIFITGVAGFIGSHLAETLLKTTDHTIIGIDNMNDYYDLKQKQTNLNILISYPNFIFYEDDIVTTTAITTHKPTIIIHLAAMAGVRYSIENPQTYTRNNVEGTTNMLNQAAQLQPQIKNFIYASSSSVYGTNTVVPFTEDHSINNCNSPYAATKKCCEIMAQLYNQLYNIPLIGLRFFTVYGPRGRPDMAPYKFLYRIANSLPITKYGDGTTMRDYTYIDDIVTGIINAMSYRPIHSSSHSSHSSHSSTHSIFNLGNSTPHTLNKFISLCEKVTNKTAIIEKLPDQQGDVPKTYADITQAKNLLKYKPKTSLEEGLRKTYEWIKTIRTPTIL